LLNTTHIAIHNAISFPHVEIMGVKPPLGYSYSGLGLTRRNYMKKPFKHIVLMRCHPPSKYGIESENIIEDDGSNSCKYPTFILLRQRFYPGDGEMFVWGKVC